MGTSPASIFQTILGGIQGGQQLKQGQQSLDIRKQQEQLEEQREERQQHIADAEFHQHLVELGAQPIINGMVKENQDLPSLTSQLLAGTPGAGVAAQPVTASGGVPIVRKANPEATVKWKDAAGGDVAYELPSVGSQAWRHMMAIRQQAQSEGERQKAQASAEGTAAGQLTGEKNELAARGVPINLPGYPSDQKILPEHLPALQAAASRRLEEAIQQFSGPPSKSPGAYAVFRAQHPDLNLPAKMDPEWNKQFIASGVAVGQQPEYNLKNAQAEAMKAYASGNSKDLDAQVDAIVPVKDPMNESTKVLLHSAASRGDIGAIQKVLQDAYDQRGRVQVAKETAKNKFDINLGDLFGSASSGKPSQTARDIAEYNVNPTTALARIPAGARERILGEVKQINPDWHQEYYNNFNKTETDATTGKIGTSANALNTMMGHLSVLNSAADALHNNDIQAINKIANFMGVQTGSNAKTTYDTIVHRLGPEVTKAYLASGGSVGERGTNEQDFSSNLGPTQLKSNIGISALLADSKIKALQDQYQRGTYGRGKQKLISDEAETARQSLTRQAPGTNAGQYVRTAKDAGGHTIGQKADGTWWDTAKGTKIQ